MLSLYSMTLGKSNQIKSNQINKYGVACSQKKKKKRTFGALWGYMVKGRYITSKALMS